MSAKPFDAEDFIEKLLSVVSLCERGSTEGERQAGISAVKRMVARAEAEARNMPAEQGRAFLARVTALQPQTAEVRETAERKHQAEAEAARKAAEQARRKREAREQAAREAQARRERGTQERFLRQAEERAERLAKEAHEREAREAQAARDREANTPSMEDILESIRKILNGDDDAGSHAAAEKPVDPAERAEAEAPRKSPRDFAGAEATAEQEAWARRQKAAWQAEQDEKRQRAETGATPRAETLEDILAESRANPLSPPRGAKPFRAVLVCASVCAFWLTGLAWIGEAVPAHPALNGPASAPAASAAVAVPAKPAIIAASTPAMTPAVAKPSLAVPDIEKTIRHAQGRLENYENTLTGFYLDQAGGTDNRHKLVLDVLLAKELALQAELEAALLRKTATPAQWAQAPELADRLERSSLALRRAADWLADHLAALDAKQPAPSPGPARPVREPRGPEVARS